MFRRNLALFFALLLLFPISAPACTAIYAGAGLTADGSTIFGRTEEYFSDVAWPKLFEAVPSALHRAGEVYKGCYGFTWTFTHDSYGYTAFRDNNSPGICPDCGGTHAHTPYQAGGTNEKGVSVTATETLCGKDAVAAVDPFNTVSGIEEAEIPTILLSEAATAREAMELLASIFSAVGAYNAGSVIVGDADEVWYIESLSGSQFAAVRLNADLLFVCPNLSVIGLIDLDDTENVYASDALIRTAAAAGTFVGDAEAHTIDFAASYEDAYESVYLRLAAALTFLSGESLYPPDAKPADFAGTDYRISNVDAEGGITVPYTGIRADRKLDIRDVFDFFRVAPISRNKSLETHVFQIGGGETVEWLSMGDNRYSVFVPCDPIAAADVFEAFGAGTAMPEYVREKPSAESFYSADLDMWGIYPEGWRNSYYWVFAALGHVAGENEEAAALISGAMRDLQEEIIARPEAGAAEKAYRKAVECLDAFASPEATH